jgi:abortive infection bacteriophage resistance protein
LAAGVRFVAPFCRLTVPLLAGFLFSDPMEYKSIDSLLDILEQRGLNIGDRSVARHYLSTVGHHRLTGFYEHFYVARKQFDAAIPATIEDVVHLYAFDRRLRLLIIGPLEKIEVALRALIIKEIGDFLLARHGGMATINLFDRQLYDLRSIQAQRNYDLAKDGCKKNAWASWIGPFSRSRLGKNMNRTQREHAFEAHYKALPAWTILQTASFGPLTHIYSILRQEIAYPISSGFNLSRSVLTTTLFALKELRNSCAHHEPIWNWDARHRSVQLLFPKAYVAPAGIDSTNENGLYAYCALIHILLSYVSHGNSTWFRRLKKLVNEYNTMYSASMGFPEDWQAMPFWCVADVSRATYYARLRTRVLAPIP